MNSVMERYAIATQASAIVVDPNHRTSADLIIASGMAQASSSRNRAAIALYRLREHIGAVDTGEIREWAMVETMRAHRGMHPRAASELFEIVLHWRLSGVCPRCAGRRFELVHAEPCQVISTTPCKLCFGRGKEPVEHRLHRKRQDAGRWLADKMEELVTWVERDMAMRLRG